MKNNGRGNFALFYPKTAHAGNHPKKRFRQFCNGFLAFCNGIALRSSTVVFENEDAGGNLADGWLLGTDEIAIGENSVAEYCIAPYGRHPHMRGMQIVDAESANEMERGAEELWAAFKRKIGHGNPIPVYRSHPDSESFPDALDKTTYGTVEKVYAGNRGVMARIAWGNEFHRLPKHMLFSPRWRMNRQADGTFRPVELISVGLTHNPNIGGTDFANSTNSTQTKGNTMLKNILIALGFTEEQAAAAETNAEGAPTEESILERIGKLKEKPAEAENPAEAKPAEAAMENETLRKALSAERAARAKMVVDNCLAEGRMSQAETATAIEILSNAKDFDAAAKLFTSRAAVWKPSSKTENLGARNTEEAANEAAEAARADRITARAQEICANEKIPWRQAYARAESECKQ